ncbi:hypothetical protein [Roseococcus sp. YIM B11640]|uniref:hypothetical protein n=1 Tax=Roseococcus sp. YIM B11640 TaxID=3133973 RepID=UPI003C79E378
MREALINVANNAYARHYDESARAQEERRGFDGWLAAIRAMSILIAAMLFVSFLTVI